MAIEDIISEQEEIRAPNMEVARGGPEDFMTVDEMDPEQDPEFQEILRQLGPDQAEVLMQLIKEFKAMVAQGFEGEFEDFVKMKMASARGGPEDFQTVDEMQIGPEEEQSIIQTGQQVAQGGRIGYQGGGDMAHRLSELIKKSNAGTITPQEEHEMEQIEIMLDYGPGEAQGGRIGYASGTDYGSFKDYLESNIGHLDESVQDAIWDAYSSGDEGKLFKLLKIHIGFEDRAQGGRIGAQEGGVMPLLNLGGMEKDYREDGGFVPLGRQEKADDVPARLSKNEFVFTADAVKAAGGGDIDEGAQRMYNVMKNLEAGGEISQESQGQA